MVKFKVTHPKHPEGAAAEALSCLKRAIVDVDAQQLDAHKISIRETDPKLFDAAIGALQAAGFHVGHPDTRSGYGPLGGLDGPVE